MTTKLTERENKMGIAIIIMGLVIAGLLVVIGVLVGENNKYNAILDMSCDYTYNTTSCRQGMKMLKGMTVEDIKDLGR